MRNESRESLIQIDNHLNRYWRISRDLFATREYALSAFLAITLIEEVGKLIVLGNRDISGELDRKSFYDHQQKYAFAVAYTLFINSRVTRIYGQDEWRLRGGSEKESYLRFEILLYTLRLMKTQCELPKKPFQNLTLFFWFALREKCTLRSRVDTPQRGLMDGKE